jgi:VanZ family protein
MNDKGSRVRRRRKRNSGKSFVFGWTMLFIILLNVGALLVFEPVRDPLDLNNYLKEDSLTHFGVFFVCTAIGGPLLLRWFSLGIVSVGLIGFGIAAEVVQAFSVDRTADFVDFVADEAGIMAALLTIAMVRQLHRWAFPASAHGSGGRHEREQSFLDRG